MSRPTMPRMIRGTSVPRSCSGTRMSIVSIVEPSRMTVVASATAAISPSLWEMMMLVTPLLSRRSRISPSRCSESSSFRAAVGSSRISRLTSFDSALAISTSCCLPTPSWPTGVTGFSFSPTRSSSSAARALVSCQLMTPPRLCSLPRKMFSAMERWGMSASS